VRSVKEISRGKRQPLCAARTRAETTAAGLAEAGAWFAAATDVDPAEIGLRDSGPAGTGIGIREGTTSNFGGWCAEAARAFRFAATTPIVVTGGNIDPISSPGLAIAIGHLRPPGM